MAKTVTMVPEPIVRRKLSDEVRERLLAMIRSGELRPGDRLPSERQLMNRFQVGRPAVREAMQALGSAGLIEIHHGERARVALPNTRGMFDRIGETALHLLQSSPQTLEHLKEARILFEVGMVRIAARKAAADDIGRLREAFERQRSVAGDPAAFVKADMAFHTAIASIGGNPICVVLSEAMLEWLFNFRRDLLRVPGSENITLAEHQRLFDAIAAHDEEGAVKAMTDHLTRASELYRILERGDAESVRRSASG